MKAIVVRGFPPHERVEFGDIADPVAEPGEVVVDLAAIDVNYPDILYMEGKYQDTPALPFVPGLAGAGRVSVLGEGASSFSVGQKVLVLPLCGTYAEKVRVPEAWCFPMPNDMPFETGAAFGLVYQTAYFALIRRGGFREGDRVLVLGSSGGVGMAAVQLARAMGARTVMAATRGPIGRSFADRLGADVVIDSAMENLRDGLKDAVIEATGGHGADIVIDPVGGAIHAAALRAMAWSGRMVVVGFASGDIPKIASNYLLVKNIAAMGLQWTDYRSREPEAVAAAQAAMFGLWSQDKLNPIVSRTLPLARYEEGLSALGSGGACGKSNFIPPATWEY